MGKRESLEYDICWSIENSKVPGPQSHPSVCFATFVVRSCDLILAKAWTCTCTWLHRHCESIVSRSSTVADLRGARGTHAPSWGPKFFQFHAVFGKIWQNRMLAPPPPPGSWRSLLGEILDPPLEYDGVQLVCISLLLQTWRQLWIHICQLIVPNALGGR